MRYRVIATAPTADAPERRLEALRRTHFDRPIQYPPNASGSLEERIMAAEERSDPVTFRVENRAQFVEGVNSYFDPDAVRAVFQPWDGRTLEKATSGRLGVEYQMHIDPALVNDMFSVMVAHAEDGGPDAFGISYRHLVVDEYRVYRPEDFPDGRISYSAVLDDIRGMISAFRPTIVSCDQFNSAYVTENLGSYVRERRLPTQVFEETATGQKNKMMYETLKFSINTGLVHSYEDRMNPSEPWRCMLQAMLESVQLVDGKLDKPRSKRLGHLDLVDCLAVLCVRLLGDQSQNRRDLLNPVSFIDNESVMREREVSARQSVNSLFGVYGRR